MATVHVGANADPHSEHHCWLGGSLGRALAACLAGVPLTSMSAGALVVLADRRRRLLRRTDRAVKLVRVGPLDIPSLLALVEAEQERTARQIASLEGVVAAIVEGSELISTDDEHDPEGPTIAYERAQATALLRQARADLDALVISRRQLELGRQVVCAACGRDITLATSPRCRPPLVVSSARPDRRSGAVGCVDRDERSGTLARRADVLRDQSRDALSTATRW